MMRGAGCQGGDPLEISARNIVTHLSMTTKRFMQVKQCMLTLQDALRQLGPDWHVAAFGSTASGFCTYCSDLDATCYREDSLHSDSDPALWNLSAIEELKMKLLPLLQEHPRFKLVEQIWTARIPILKLKFYVDKRCRGTIDVDLSCHNTEPLSNTGLLRAYCKLSSMVRSLVMIIKHWAKAEQVSGAIDKNLSSYSITLMVIYYLLVTPSLSMPCLPTEAHRFPENDAQQKSDTKWTSPQPLATLIRGFFNFFARGFKWGEEVVSVRLGKRLSVRDETYCQLKGRYHARLHIEDPYLLGRNLNCALAQERESVLRTKLTWTSQLLQQGIIPASLHDLPLVAQTAKDETSTGQGKADQKEVMDSNEIKAILPPTAHNDKSKRFDAGSELHKDESKIREADRKSVV